MLLTTLSLIITLIITLMIICYNDNISINVILNVNNAWDLNKFEQSKNSRKKSTEITKNISVTFQPTI